SYAEATRALGEALEQQTATSEILEIIRRSGDLQPVFDTIARNAVRVCDGRFAAVLLVQGDQLHLAAHHHFTPADLQAMNRMLPSPVAGRPLPARAAPPPGRVHISGTGRAP